MFPPPFLWKWFCFSLHHEHLLEWCLRSLLLGSGPFSPAASAFGATTGSEWLTRDERPV